MAAAKKNDSAGDAGQPEVSFETALERIESIVESLENGDVALADLLSRYEEASTLLKSCQRQLDQAQLRIEKLSRKDENGLALEPFDADA